MPVEPFPFGIAVNQHAGTAYVTSVLDSDVDDGEVSLVGLGAS